MTRANTERANERQGAQRWQMDRAICVSCGDGLVAGMSSDDDDDDDDDDADDDDDDDETAVKVFAI